MKPVAVVALETSVFLYFSFLVFWFVFICSEIDFFLSVLILSEGIVRVLNRIKYCDF